MKLRQIIIITVAVTIIGGAVGLSKFLGEQKEPPEKKEVKEFKKYVKTEVVNYANLKTQVVGYGRVQTAESLELIAEVPGKMTRAGLPLKEGQRFPKGVLLYTIDDTEAGLNLQAQKSNFLRDLAECWSSSLDSDSEAAASVAIPSNNIETKTRQCSVVYHRAMSITPCAQEMMIADDD